MFLVSNKTLFITGNMSVWVFFQQPLNNTKQPTEIACCMLFITRFENYTSATYTATLFACRYCMITALDISLKRFCRLLDTPVDRLSVHHKSVKLSVKNV